jgi:hypothetical protein
MAKSPDPHVVIINRNYPPRTGVTGESACTLATYLQDEHSVDISVVTVRSAYSGGGTILEPVGTVHEIGSLYDGKKKLIRLFASFVESFRLVWKARRLAGSQTIVMTDPPFLAFWAAILLGKKRHWTLWSMDLFPDAFVAGNLISKKSIFYQVLNNLVYRTAPKSLIALGPLQAEYLHSKYDRSIDTAIIPCGVYQHKSADEIPEWKSNHTDKIVMGYCGNLGEAHSIDFLKAIIEQLDPKKHHLVLSLYGVRAAEVLKSISPQQEGISIVSSVAREELGFIDIHLVSLLKHWSHVCVPSKAVSAVCSGSAFLFYGTTDCDNWKLLSNAGWIIEETDRSNVRREVASFFSTLNRDTLAAKQQLAKETAVDLQDCVAKGNADVAQFLTNLVA